jgi:SAM-dependent methyltransferase
VTALNPTGVLEDYARGAERLFDSFEEISPADVYAPVAHLLPAQPSRFADIGAGTGRDAAWFAEKGHSVLAIEPTEYFRTAGMALHPSPRIEWLGDALPYLARTLARGDVFDRVILCAVWQHLRDADRAVAMPNLARLLAPGGLLIMSLRHGPDEPGSYPARREDTEELARASGLSQVFAGEAESVHPASRALGVTWTWLGFAAAPSARG